MPQTTIHNLWEYVQEISKLNDNLICNGANLHEILLFRGQSNEKYDIIPALGRGRKYSCDISIFNEERNLIELAKYKMPDVFQNNMEPIELLALLQHYGIPTRLLDVTENAFVALYFACISPSNNGEVFAFKTNERDVTNYPIINAIADTYRITRGAVYELSLFYGSAKSQPYFLEQQQLHNIIHETDEQGGLWIKRCCDSILYVYAPFRTIRQRMQRGRYILFPNKIKSYNSSCDKFAFNTIIESIPKDHDDIIGRIVIPEEDKNKILSDLALFGISKETMFSDSIDKVCESIVESCKHRVHGDKRWYQN